MFYHFNLSICLIGPGAEILFDFSALVEAISFEYVEDSQDIKGPGGTKTEEWSRVQPFSW